jgi:tetratricopeptide (TPR) repeat protein
MAKVSLRAYNREIETMIDRGQFDEAIAHCRHILKTYPKHLETYRLLGKAYLESKRYDDAVDIFSRILTAVPNDFVAQVGMSIIRDEEKNLDEAIWHMERAFETQPSNPAIQGELQRLYGRRDGMKPPRIRMTRGALANMYVQGELYPQAISEIKNVLKDDPERADMQALLARALYKNGVKNEAADVASALLRRYPYSLDANRVLVEALGSEHPENAQIYRQRVFELDPYAAQVAGSIFLAHEVSDAAVNIDRLDWDGRPVALAPDWKDSQAISLETGSNQPDWLSEPSSFGGIESEPTSSFGTTPSEEAASFGSIVSPSASMFGATPEPSPAEPAETIPDFLRAAGWGAATGAFDESKSTFGEEEEKTAEPIEQGDLPDWVKAMKPSETQAPAPTEEEEEIPDWIKSIGLGAIASQAFDKKEQPAEEQVPGVNDATQWLTAAENNSSPAPQEDQSTEFAWLNNLDETEAKAEPAAGTEDADWLKSLGVSQTMPSSEEQPDWLKGLGEPGTSPAESQPKDDDWIESLNTPEASPSAEEQPDWLKTLGEPQAAAPAEGLEDLDWLKDLAGPEETPSSIEQQEQPDWLKGLGESRAAPEQAQAEDLDWLKGLGTPEEETASFKIEEEAPDWLKSLGEPESTPSSASDDHPDWLKGLAMAGTVGAVSQLAQDDESQEKETSSAASGGEDEFLNQLTEEPVLPASPEARMPGMDLDKLGTSEQEQDDSFAWLESLAAKQGATEGLLTKPEDRLDEEPDWVKQAKGLKGETPASPSPAAQPAASLENLGKSEQDQDDSFAWLESLAAKQGATEGLLTKPEDRLEEEPDWVKQARDLNQQPLPPAAVPQAEPEAPAKPTEPEAQAETVQPVDEVESWLRNLEGEKLTLEPESEGDETGIWMMKALDETETPSEKAAAGTEPATEMPDWMKNIQEGQEERSTAIFAEEAELESTWMPPAEEPEPVAESKAEDTLPSWLSELDREENKVSTPSNTEDLPDWLLAEETAPGNPEPTIFSDWKPVEGTREEPVTGQEPAEEQPEAEIPAVSLEMPEAETVLEPEQPQAQLEPEPAMEIPLAQTAPQPEPAPRHETAAPATAAADPVLTMARNELTRNNLQGSLDSYGKLIKKARYLDEVIYDLRDALYRYPVDVNLWQSLGDAYMRANRLQDALDAYTKAEELLR